MLTSPALLRMLLSISCLHINSFSSEAGGKECGEGERGGEIKEGEYGKLILE